MAKTDFLELGDPGGTIRLVAKTPRGMGPLAERWVRPESLIDLFDRTTGFAKQAMLFDDRFLGIKAVTLDPETNTVVLALRELAEPETR
jgi:hypothetical protein